MAHRERLMTGSGGWVRYTTSRVPVAAVYIRYEDIDGQLRPVDLFVQALDRSTLSTDVLRDIALGRIDAWVNDKRNAAMIRGALDEPSSDLRRAAQAFTTRYGEHADGSLVRDNWVCDMYWAQVPDSGVPQAPLHGIPRPQEKPDEEVQAERAAALELAALEVPESKPYGDDFYAAVAAAYNALLRWTHKPAAEIADSTGVEVHNVHNWIREARKRGYLGAGRRGKVG